jgi:Dyp-type peroxidase family
MVLRSGYKQGPATGWDVAGAASGVALVLLLIVFVAAAGATRDGYSQVQDTISKLGATGTPEVWFTVVNVANFFLILAFAYAVQRRIPLGVWTFCFLVATGIGALFVGGFRCSDGCHIWARDAHTLSADVTALMILGFMWAAAIGALRHRPPPSRWFRNVSVGLAVIDLAFLLVLFGIALNHGRDEGIFERLYWAAAYLWVLAASISIALATRRRVKPVEFDTSLLQRKILRSKRSWTHAAYIGFGVEDRARTKQWLRFMIDAGLVRPDDGESSPGSVTVAFSAAGLRWLGIKPTGGRDLEPFVQGMRARADILGDHDGSGPDHWQLPWSSDRLHVLVWVEAEHRRVLGELVERIQGPESRNALTRIGDVQYAATAGPGKGPGPVGELRFEDGISQPWLALRGGHGHDARRAPGGALDPFGEWRPLAVGEFVLGELDESGDRSLVPEPRALFEHGSFVVVRKLAQDFAALKDLVDGMAAQTPRFGAAGADFAERMMGRRRDGHPLEFTESQPGRNDFSYAPDPDGLRCPLGAHIRRANPRDALGFGTLMAARHRIIRRGKAYDGDPAAPPRWSSGLVFVAINARIADQFEFIQSLWLNDGSRQRVGTSRDLFAGASRSTSRAVLQLDCGPVVTDAIPTLVRTMGGEYFFAPSMAGLRYLADTPTVLPHGRNARRWQALILLPSFLRRTRSTKRR